MATITAVRLHLVAVSFLLVSACGGGGGNDQESQVDGSVGTEVDAGVEIPDDSWLYQEDHLLEVAIEIDESDWDQLRLQTRNILGILGENCGMQPAESPFTYFPGSVSVDGITIANVGVRKKGFLGSLNETKPSLKIKFDKFVDEQRLSGLKRLTLNNGHQDPSIVNQCLGYQVFTKAGVPAPRCNYAHVTLNGASLGVYVHVEEVKKPFLRRHFADDSGNLYEGTLSDFRDGWMGTFERKTNKSMPEGNEDRSDIQEIRAAMDLDDNAMYTALEQLIDLDEFMRFWAVETMLSHWDGYSGNNNNFFVYDDPSSGLINFMPWGVDQLFGASGGTVSGLPVAATKSELTRRLFLYAPARTRYLGHFQDILESAWNDDELIAESKRMKMLIAGSVRPAKIEEFNAGLTSLEQVLTGRKDQLLSAHSAASPSDAQSIGQPLCFDSDGSVDISFSTIWEGGAGAVSSASIEISNASIPFNMPFSVALPSKDVVEDAVLFVSGRTSATRSVNVFITIPKTDVGPGTTEVGEERVQGFLFFQDDGAPEPDGFVFLSGTMSLTDGGVTQGAPWIGTLALTAWTSDIF